VAAEATIAAPAGAVWALVIDLTTPARFSNEFRGAEWLDPTGPALGARFVGHNEHAAIGSWDTESVIDVFEPLRAFGWAVGGTEAPAARWRFLLEDVDGGVRLVQEATMGPGPSGLTPAIAAYPDKEERIVARRLAEWETNMRATVDGIKQLAEESA
jgi:hypothetical protein